MLNEPERVKKGRRSGKEKRFAISEKREWVFLFFDSLK
jgi:hypothetical protein